MGHLRGLTVGEALLGQRRCPCGRQVQRVEDGEGSVTYQCASIAEDEQEPRT
jgi:hypothetical protein